MSKKLLKHILPRIRATKDRTYEVLYVDNFLDEKQVGRCDFNTSQITIKNNESPTETFKTYIHEILHALSNEYEAGLTETQVQKMELAIFKFLKLNKYL